MEAVRWIILLIIVQMLIYAIGKGYYNNKAVEYKTPKRK